MSVVTIYYRPTFLIVLNIFAAGPSGDKRGSDEVELWMHNYFDATVGKPVKFYQAAKGINFQVT